jgi:hypothetical protein
VVPANRADQAIGHVGKWPALRLRFMTAGKD